jgi:hypothetical protein
MVSIESVAVQPNWHDRQGTVFLAILRLPLDITIPWPDWYVSLTHAMRQLVLGSELKGKLVWRLSLGIDVGLGFESQSNLRDCRWMMRHIALRVVSKLIPLVRATEAEELCALGQCAAAQYPLQKAIDFGHLPSRALKAWLLLDGREGVAKDRKRAFELVEEGTRLGCHHCQGVMAECYLNGLGCTKHEALSLKFARESSEVGSRFGQFALGKFYERGGEDVRWDYVQAIALYRLAAAQNLDDAQYCLGSMYYDGQSVVQDYKEALRWNHLAAAQGHPGALFYVAASHEYGEGVPENKEEAIRWYECAQAAGIPEAEEALLRLRA